MASIIQLSVPVIATIGGVLFLTEDLTSRVMVSSILTLGGILITKLKFRS